MRSQTSTPECKQRQSRRLLLVGGFTVPAIVLGSVLATSPAFADNGGTAVTSKHAVSQAFSTPPAADPSTASEIDLTRNLTGDGGTDDVLTLQDDASLTLDLQGHTLEVDQITLGTGSTLTIKDTAAVDGAAANGKLIVGDIAKSGAPDTSAGGGIALSHGADLAITGDTQVESTGTDGAPGVGVRGIIPSGTEHVTVSGQALLTANGGKGAAGVGGGTGTGGVNLTINGISRVQATAGDPVDSATDSPASAVGAGEGGTSTAITAVGASAKLDARSSLRVDAVAPDPSNSSSPSATVVNHGEIDIAAGSKAVGAGVLENDGTISGDVDSDLKVTGHNYAVTLDAGQGTGADTSGFRIYGPSLGTTVDDRQPTLAGKHFVGWNTQADLHGVGNTSTDARTLPAGSTDGDAVTVALKAIYRNLISFQDGTIHLTKGYDYTENPIDLPVGGDDITGYTADETPDGITVDPTGKITGTATTDGPSHIHVSVTSPYQSGDSAATHTFDVVVGDAPTFDGQTTDLYVTDGEQFGGTVVAAGEAAAGEDGLTYTTTASTVGGLTLNPDGSFSGDAAQPSGGTTATFDVVAHGLYGDSASQTFTLHFGTKPTFAAGEGDLGLAGIGTSKTFVINGASESDGVTTYTVNSTTLAGLTWTPSSHTFAGTVAGTPETDYTVDVTAHNQWGDSAPQTYTLHVGKLATIDTALPTALAIGDQIGGSADGIQLHSDGTGSVDTTYTVPRFALPAGLSLSNTGVLSGSLSAPRFGPTLHRYAFTVTAHNAYGTTTKDYALQTGAAPTITTTSLADASVGGLYETTIGTRGDLVADGDQDTFSLTGDVPPGLTIDQHGLLHGSVSDAATYDHFAVHVHTTFGDADQPLTLVADHGAGLIMGDLAPVTVGKPYTASVANGGQHVTYSEDGALAAAGLQLDTATGAITGTVTTADPIHVTVTATNTFGTTRHEYVIAVGTAPTITTDDLQQGVVGDSLTEQLAADGSAAGHATWEQTGGDLPTGIDLAADGTLSGSFHAAGTYTYRVKATTVFGSVTRTYTTVVGLKPAVATTALPGAQAGTAYSVPVEVAGSGTVTVAVTGLPDGLTYSTATGRISGTPKNDGHSTVTIAASSRFGDDSKTIDLAVAAAPVVTPVPTQTTPAPTQSAPAQSTPAPTQSAPAQPTPAPTHSAPAPAPAAPVLAAAPTATAKFGHPMALSVAASSTVAVTYSVKGRLPKGVALDAKRGLISGTPKESGSFAFTVTAKSSAGKDVQAYKVVVPEKKSLISVASGRITAPMGAAFDVQVGGLKKGEHWRIAIGKKTLAHGVAAHAGSVTASVTLPKTRSDKGYTVTASTSRTVTDPATTASRTFTVTAVSASKTLKLKRAGTAVDVTKLAARELVHVTIDGKQVAEGRADAKGVFAFTPKGLKAGKHAVAATGITSGRGGALTLTVKK